MNKLLVKPALRWYEQAPNPERCVAKDQLVNKLSQMCQDQLLEEAQHYKTYKEQSSSRSDFRWVDMVRKKGSLQDRAAAFSLLLQDSPIHNLDCLDTLIQWVSPKGKRECFIAMDALVDLFLQYLLPASRKLVPFEHRPLDTLDMNKRTDQSKCLVWYLEGQLKKRYMRFIENVEKLSYDKVEASKSKAVKTFYTLLAEHPEQEQFLLTRLVNKFGDPMRKIAAKTSHVLSELTGKHPAMKPVVLAEVESLLFRKNITPKAQYYALCYLSTMVLTSDEYELALKLVHIYLNFFKMCVKAGEADTKLMAVLLTGVNRAHPFCSTDEELISRENEDVLFRLIYMSSLSIAIQCLMLLFQVLKKKNSGLTARFYSALYKKLLDPNMAVTHHQLMMFNLIYKAVRADENSIRVTAFIKRMLQLCLAYPPNLACSMLLIIAHVLKERPQLLLATPQPQQNSATKTDASKDTAKSTKQRNTEDTGTNGTVVVKYDPHTDNPVKAGVENTLCYELHVLSRHYHPSVALFATEILHRTRKGVEYYGDPLKDFTLMHFLDRFVYRSPKAQSHEAHDKVFGRSQSYEPKGVRRVPVGSAAYMSRHESAIPVDEAFLFKYFVESGRRTDGTGVNARANAEDVEDLDSDEADEFLGDIDNHMDLEDADFYSEFKEGRAKQKAAARSGAGDASDDEEANDEMSDDEEIEEGMEEEDFDDEENALFDKATLARMDGLAESGDEGDSEESEGDEDGEESDDEFEMDEDFSEAVADSGKKQMKRSKSASSVQLKSTTSKKIKSKKFDINELTVSADRFQSMLDSNRGSDASGSLHALSAKTASGKVSDAKQLDWERKRRYQLFGKRKPKGGKFKRGKMGKKPASGNAGNTVIKFKAQPNKAAKKRKNNK